MRDKYSSSNSNSQCNCGCKVGHALYCNTQQPMSVSEQIAQLESKLADLKAIEAAANKRERLRASALKKLTQAEKDALGL